MENLKLHYLHTDVLIAGGGTAGCYAAYKLAQDTAWQILIAEKANIRRSGCLAAGVNALNAYITKNHTPDSYVDYAKRDAEGIVRGDLLMTMAKRLNACAADLEKLGLVILKNSDGSYQERGPRNIKINGENIKTILADSLREFSQIKIHNHINIIDFLIRDKQIFGAVAIDVIKPVLYIIEAKAVLCSTGGAAGLYRPNNPGFSKHKMWYCPFNTGAGLAAGMRSGAEMTTLEMRFIALRCKDTIAPTGTIAQGVGAKQINASGTVYENKYGLSTANRLYGTVMENTTGKGPCFLRTVGISAEKESNLYQAYLNMSPSQTLSWVENGSPRINNVEVEGTEPYIVGGHAGAGFWLSTDRQTTLKGLFAAGDAAGGCPQKYVTGAMAESAIAAIAIDNYLKTKNETKKPFPYRAYGERYQKQETQFFNSSAGLFSIQELEEAMQKIMDEYAGGIKTGYSYNENSLHIAQKKIKKIVNLTAKLSAKNMQELIFIHELKDRLEICLFLLAHLKARKETRWHSFAQNSDYPQQDIKYTEYINSYKENDHITIVHRPIVTREEHYEHQN